MHGIIRMFAVFVGSLPLALFWLKQNSMKFNTWGKDIHLFYLDAWAGCNTSKMMYHYEPLNSLGPGAQAVDLNFRKRYHVEREAYFFRKSIEKEATVAQWSNLRKADVERIGWKWDPKLDAEHKSAQKMLKELDEAKSVGGAKGRDEWVAHYLKRYNDKLPLPRHWWNIFANLSTRDLKHPILLTSDELPWYSFTHRSSATPDKIREMSVHPYVEAAHELHYAEKYLGGSGGGHH